jgi:hypothetical protein
LAVGIGSTLVLEAGSITANAEYEDHCFFGPASTGAFASRLVVLRTVRLGIPDTPAEAAAPDGGTASGRSAAALSQTVRQRSRRAAAVAACAASRALGGAYSADGGLDQAAGGSHWDPSIG